MVAAGSAACSTASGTCTTVPLGAAVRVSVAVPAGVPAGRVTLTDAAPSVTGAVPSVVSPTYEMPVNSWEVFCSSSPYWSNQ